MHRLSWLLLAASLAGSPFGAWAEQPAQPSPFTPEQQAAIIEIVRSALKADSTILRDAILSLQQQEEQGSAGSRDVIANRRDIYAADDPIAGNPHGGIVLVEFFDVQCPYCRRMLPAINQLLLGDHDVKLILKDLPVLGPPSLLGAQALLAARPQGAYLKMQAALMQEGVTVDEAVVQRAALALGLNWPRLKHDMADPAVGAEIGANLALARKLGIEGTPALVAGDHLFSGAASLEDLKKIVAALRR